MSKYTYNKNFFEKINTEEKAYWLGFLYADGSITRFYRNEKLRSMSLELTLQHNDRGHLFKFLKDIDSNVPIQNKTIKLNNKVFESHRIVINCTKMCRDLIELGCIPCKSLKLKFPSDDIVPKFLIKDFIRGYFDGDGCIFYGNYNVYHKNRRKYYSHDTILISFVGTKEFLTSLFHILEKNNIYMQKIKHGNTGKAYEMRLNGLENIYKFYNYVYNNSSVKLKRKDDKFNFIFKSCSPIQK